MKKIAREHSIGATIRPWSRTSLVGSEDLADIRGRLYELQNEVQVRLTGTLLGMYSRNVLVPLIMDSREDL